MDVVEEKERDYILRYKRGIVKELKGLFPPFFFLSYLEVYLNLTCSLLFRELLLIVGVVKLFTFTSTTR